MKVPINPLVFIILNINVINNNNNNSSSSSLIWLTILENKKYKYL